jgi:hypothetical protein
MPIRTRFRMCRRPLNEVSVFEVPLHFVTLFQPLWLPDALTEASGREMTATTCLGPFLAISVFAEEDPAVAEKYFNGKQSSSAVRSLAKQLQTELEMLRVRFTFSTTDKAVTFFSLF